MEQQYARSAAFLGAGLLALTLSTSMPAEAQTPDRELLRELESRLLQPPDCVPRCAEIAVADVEARGDSIGMTLTVHAAEEVAIPLPGSERGWRPQAIALDGSAAAEILRASNEALWLRVSPGRHTVVLRGVAPPVDSLEIPFPTPPRVIEVDSDGWLAAGIKDRRLLSGSLQLTRLQSEQGGDAMPRWESSRFPAFVRVERNLELDLDWRVTTTVVRVAPAQGALTLEIPLIEGESVLSEHVTATGSAVLVSMEPTQRAVTWVSDSSVFTPSGVMGTSETRRRAPRAIRLWWPTMKIVAVSMSYFMRRSVLPRASRRFINSSVGHWMSRVNDTDELIFRSSPSRM